MPTVTTLRFAAQFTDMAHRAQGRSFSDWPSWSTGEILMVALILDRFDVLHALGFTMLEALARVDLFTLAELRDIASQVAA